VRRRELDLRDLPDLRALADRRALPDLRDLPDLSAFEDLKDLLDLADRRALPDLRALADRRALADLRALPDLSAFPDLRDLPDLRALADRRDLPDLRDLPPLRALLERALLEVDLPVRLEEVLRDLVEVFEDVRLPERALVADLDVLRPPVDFKPAEVRPDLVDDRRELDLADDDDLRELDLGRPALFSETPALFFEVVEERERPLGLSSFKAEGLLVCLETAPSALGADLATLATVFKALAAPAGARASMFCWSKMGAARMGAARRAETTREEVI